MRTLQFIVDGQNLIKDPNCDFENIVKGSHNYLSCWFSLSRDWSGCKVAVSFLKNEKEIDAVMLENYCCMVPNKVSELQSFYIKLVGVRKDGYKIVSKKCYIRQGG